ncbi:MULTISPECIES: hypothetical protein [Campylobacter]|uniref:Uncharacterized protein n=2 Tax=Campylobacter coli TaxID=195 RepID=A0A3Z9V8P5_CAMCO|nr:MULTISPECIES: hypothetical protein [Campylobacter]ALL33989.1 hypothetical protein AR448_06820 [Campylobacter coli]EAC1763326.1 hypothetical protein [Campylobacter coli]EAH4662487.1 hypothetical protein [Campylobacter coli]EAH4679511.1 hypothetical protein [Campylobacter coli]EAH4803880.1 hypothetical protein [Campylobacter coli]
MDENLTQDQQNASNENDLKNKENEDQNPPVTENEDEGQTQDQNPPVTENEEGEKMAKEALIQLPRSLEQIISKDLLSINVKIDLESNANLALGMLLISEDFGETFKKCPDDLAGKSNFKLGLLKDDVFANGNYGVLLMGEVNLLNVNASIKQAAFLQNLIINTKE